MDKTVLVVDDEAGIVKALSRLLSRSGYSVKTALSGEEALSILQVWPCKVLLTDFRMPGMDGAELLSKVRTDYPQIVGLVLSGYSDFNSVKKLLNAGTAFRYLQKPWEDEELLAEIENALRCYRQRRFQQQASSMLIASSLPLAEIAFDGRIIQANAKAASQFGEQVRVDNIFQHIIAESDRNKLDFAHFQVGCSQFITFENRAEVEITCRLRGESSCIIELTTVTVPVLLDTVFELPAMLNFVQLLQLTDSYLKNGKPLALIAVKVRSFDSWSLSMGYQEAENKLELIAEQLLSAVQSHGELGFLANEQFVIALPGIMNEMELLQRLSQMLSITTDKQANAQPQTDFAVCYCLVPEDGSEARAILNNLLLGNMLVAESPSRMFIRYDKQAIERKKYQLSLIKALQFAVEKQQLLLHFQPKYDLAKRKLCGCEALIRWQHEDYGAVSPALFIPIAEQNGQIVEIGYWVLLQAFRTLVNWEKQGKASGKMAVNISGRQLMEPGFIQWVKHHLADTKVDASKLEFELTETFLLDNFDECNRQLSELRNMGISIAIDDFGTGYSSLAYLNKLPCDVLKIDRSLVIDVESNLQSQTLIANIVRLAHDLNLKVVVEGIETKEQLDIINAMGCDVIQGYCISRPLPEEGYLNLLASTKAVEMAGERHV